MTKLNDDVIKDTKNYIARLRKSGEKFPPARTTARGERRAKKEVNLSEIARIIGHPQHRLWRGSAAHLLIESAIEEIGIAGWADGELGNDRVIIKNDAVITQLRTSAPMMSAFGALSSYCSFKLYFIGFCLLLPTNLRRRSRWRSTASKLED